ncbi:deoxyuridine 5'-triphosphate nucleotidohydrolase [Halolamina litorea]|uniref:Deoxyuridine 5'-triphosphate nucleotidohydrolase n=1 Tax=Halolamina litorea TaxID=1515593 RepID=A0ABD6BSU3_9EURY|nr:deoxyuridine 5'-triphosphate nucleotidohydrolase [Halolamina litorea]
MFRSGASVADDIDGADDDAVQPNGVDLTVAAVFEQTSPGYVGRDDKSVGDRSEVDPHGGDPPVYRLEPGDYVVRYGERLAVPEDSVGFVLPRSTLLRNSCTLNTAVWDAGYEGRGEGLLQVGHEIEIEQGARIGQFVVADADHEGTYDGAYQGEN